MLRGPVLLADGGSDPECDGWYYGAWERDGRYLLTVSAPGYQTASVSGIDVDKDECHVSTESVPVELTK